MNRLALFLVAALVAISSVCCLPAREARRSTAALLTGETVTLARYNSDGEFRPYCSGVWVSASKILTAEHCADELGKPDEIRKAEFFHEFFPDDAPIPPRWDPTGQKTAYALIVDSTGDELADRGREAVVISIDRKADLALLEAVPGGPEHPWVELGDDPKMGDRVEVCGHPMGMVWSYSEGVATGVRWMPSPNGEDLGKSPFLQYAASGVYFGNSGSGVFDEDGRLVGITSFMLKSGSIFAVSRGEVAKFLKDLRVIKP